MLYIKIRTHLHKNRKQFLLKDENGKSRWINSSWIREAYSQGHRFEGIKVSKNMHVLDIDTKNTGYTKSKEIASQKTNKIDGSGANNYHGFKVLLGKYIEDSIEEQIGEAKRERSYVRALTDSLMRKPDKKVHILFGLRATGKTVAIWHCIKRLRTSGIPANEIVFIDCKEARSAEILESLIYKLSSMGVKYFFIDEASVLKEIISKSHAIASHLASKVFIVLAGTDSFVFVEAVKDYLYHRYVAYPLSIRNRTVCELAVYDGNDEFMMQTLESYLGSYGTEEDLLKTAEKYGCVPQMMKKLAEFKEYPLDCY